MGWNPRYVLFAQEQDRTPEQQQEADREAYPVASGMPFILWVSAKRQAFQREHPECFDAAGGLKDNDAFGRWLARDVSARVRRS